MSVKEHAIITVLVLGIMMTFIFLGGCTQVTHSNEPTWEYPVK